MCLAVVNLQYVALGAPSVYSVVSCEINPAVDDCSNSGKLGLLKVKFDCVVPRKGLFNFIEYADAMAWLYSVTVNCRCCCD